MRPRSALVAAASAAFATWATFAAGPVAFAQAPTPARCPSAAQVAQADLLGLWRAELAGQGHVATLLLEPNPRWEGSLAGTITRQGRLAELSGDVDKGEFTLEESEDGTHVSGSWVGEVVESSCGHEIRGTWQGPDDQPEQPFVLRWVGPR